MMVEKGVERPCHGSSSLLWWPECPLACQARGCPLARCTATVAGPQAALCCAPLLPLSSPPSPRSPPSLGVRTRPSVPM
jgi:hypothetical protein